MVVGRIGVPVDIPEVIWLMGMALGSPVMVLGGVWVLVPEDGVGVLELTELDEPPREELWELDELGEGLAEVGFCLSTRWR